jgi:hypothetical protein
MIQKKYMMKKTNKFYLLATVFICMCLFNSCKGKTDYPPVDQLQITNKHFLEACDTMINITNRMNKEIHYNKNYYINSFVIQVGKINGDIMFEFMFDNSSSIGYAVYHEYKIYGYFYYKNCIFLVQYHTSQMIPNIFRKTGSQNKITFVGHFHQSFFSKLFEDKREIAIVPNYEPRHRSFRYINGKFIMY